MVPADAKLSHEQFLLGSSHLEINVGKNLHFKTAHKLQREICRSGTRRKEQEEEMKEEDRRISGYKGKLEVIEEDRGIAGYKRSRGER